jgi:hypothetical protein
MTTKRKIVIAAGITLLVVIIGVVAARGVLIHAVLRATRAHDLVEWVDSGSSVAELASQADLIVRVRVISSEVRVLRQTLPQWAADGKTVTRYVEDAMPFTDSEMQVLEFYKGSPDDTITVMQTGALRGTVPADVEAFSFASDPIFRVGSEHILFLVDITKDGVHSTGRKLYRTMNPYGRYELIESSSMMPLRLTSLPR